MKEHILYWAQCLEEGRELSDDKIVASRMVGIISSPTYHDYSFGSKADPDYIEVWDLAADLEVPDDDKEFRKMKWGMIEKRVQILHERYVSLQVPTSNHQ